VYVFYLEWDVWLTHHCQDVTQSDRTELYL